jgi:N-acetylneuraminic acid mutarotase
MTTQRRPVRSVWCICFILLIAFLISANLVKAATFVIFRNKINSLSFIHYWQDVSTNDNPLARFGHTSVWTGSEMIVWGGALTFNTTLNDGAGYDPTTDSWAMLSTTGAPSARYAPMSVWTGSEMIVWGGNSLGWGLGSHLNDGARYNPTTDSWTPISTTGAPSARFGHTSVWTGSEMIIWGGRDDSSYFNDGTRYNPTTDRWTPISTTGAPSARTGHTSVWTGSEMIIWGGSGSGSYLNDGARYRPTTDSWTPVSTTGSPTARFGHTSVWTGSEMIVWGGRSAYFIPNDGARYSPATDSWTPISITGAPTARTGHTSVWTGSQMIVWGGSGNVTGWGSYLRDGAGYNPTTDSWTPLPTTGAPSARIIHTAVWTSFEMIIWGGWNGNNPGDNSALNNGARLREYDYVVYLPLCVKK